MNERSPSDLAATDGESGAQLAEILADHLSAPGDLLALLDRLAERSADPSFARAARALRHPYPGRPAYDDKAALEEALALLRTGQVHTVNRALHLVVRRMAVPRERRRSAIERLRRKMKKSST